MSRIFHVQAGQSCFAVAAAGTVPDGEVLSIEYSG
jgi:hypothetical protein